MANSYHIKEKILRIITNLVCRSIEEAKKVPYIIEQDNIVDILIRNPALYQQMLLEGRLEGGGVPKGKLLVKLDMLSQIREFSDLDRFDMSFAASTGHESTHAQIFAQINLLTKLFTAYNSNMMSTFERNYELFLERYQQTLQSAAKNVTAQGLLSEDLFELEKIAESHLVCGRFIESFSFSRLLNPEVIKDHFIRFPSFYLFSEKLIQNAPKDEEFHKSLIKFILRACYMSHNSWRDIFSLLVNLAEEKPQQYHRSLLIELIEQDFVFCCNLLHTAYNDLNSWTSAQRKQAIENRLYHDK